MSKIVRCIAHMNFNIVSSTNITNLFGNWLHRVNKKDTIYICVEAYAFLWALWNLRNDVIFNRSKAFIFFVGYILLTTYLDLYTILFPSKEPNEEQ
jgi:hypothetical protein